MRHDESLMTETIENTEEITQDYYNELVTFFRASYEATENQEPELAEAKELISATESYYQRGQALVEDISGRRFGDATVGDKIYEGFAKVSANVASFFSGIGKHSDSKMLRDCYTNLVAASCGLQMLYTTEVAGFGESKDSKALLELLKEHHQLVMRYGHIIPSVVATELAMHDDTRFTSVQRDKIVQDIQSTWDS